MDLQDNIPVYVTRKSADGETGSWTMSAWMPLLAMAIVWFNVVVWGLISLAYAIATVVSVFA